MGFAVERKLSEDRHGLCRPPAAVKTRFKNREDAGRRLAAELRGYAGRDGVMVLGLPRGGIPVAVQVAEALQAPLDVFVVRKLGLPWHEELAMGALASGGVRVLDADLIRIARVTDAEIDHVTMLEQTEMERRESRYRGDRPFPELFGKTVILVDDGLATGSTMRAAVEALRKHRPGDVIVAVPVAPPDVCDAFGYIADEIICAETPEPFQAVGLWYEDFSQTTDDEVHWLLERSRRSTPAPA